MPLFNKYFLKTQIKSTKVLCFTAYMWQWHNQRAVKQARVMTWWHVFVLQRNRLSLFRLHSSISALWLKVHEEEKWTGKFWQLLLQKSENQRCRDGSRWGISVFRPSVHHSVIQIKATSEPESAEMNAAWCGKNNVNQCDSRTITYSSSLTLTPISHLPYK